MQFQRCIANEVLCFSILDHRRRRRRRVCLEVCLRKGKGNNLSDSFASVFNSNIFNDLSSQALESNRRRSFPGPEVFSSPTALGP